MPVFNDDNTPQITGLVLFLTFVYMPFRFRNFGLSKCLLHTCFWGVLNALFVGGHFIRIETLDSFSLFLLLLHVSACTLSVDNSVFCQILLRFFQCFLKFTLLPWVYYLISFIVYAPESGTGKVQVLFPQLN